MNNDMFKEVVDVEGEYAYGVIKPNQISQYIFEDVETDTTYSSLQIDEYIEELKSISAKLKELNKKQNIKQMISDSLDFDEPFENDPFKDIKKPTQYPFIYTTDKDSFPTQVKWSGNDKLYGFPIATHDFFIAGETYLFTSEDEKNQTFKCILSGENKESK